MSKRSDANGYGAPPEINRNPEGPIASENQMGGHASDPKPKSLSLKFQKDNYKIAYGDSVTFGVKIFPETV